MISGLTGPLFGANEDKEVVDLMACSSMRSEKMSGVAVHDRPREERALEAANADGHGRFCLDALSAPVVPHQCECSRHRPWHAWWRFANQEQGSQRQAK